MGAGQNGDIYIYDVRRKITTREMMGSVNKGMRNGEWGAVYDSEFE